MPNKDKTGPEGKGPRTGRGLGDCEEPKKKIRQLNEEEKTLINKQIKRYDETKNYLQYQLKYYDLMISEGLEQNYLLQLKKFKKDRGAINKEIVSNDSIVEILNKQLVEGVEIKIKEEEK